MQSLDDSKLNFKNTSDDKITLFSDRVRLDLEFKLSSNKEYGTDFDVYANFSSRGFYKNTQLSLEDKLSVLSTYENFLDSKLHDKIEKKSTDTYKLTEEFDEETEFDDSVIYKKSMYSKFKDFFDEVKCIPSLLRDIRALHIITYVDNEALIKSIIQLDADIYNIISKKLGHKEYEKTFALHIYNMRYGRYLIQQRINKFFDSIEPAAKFVGAIISAAYVVPWMIFEIMNMPMASFGTIVFDGNTFDFMYILSNIYGNGGEAAKNYDTIIRIATQVFVIPTIIFKIVPKIGIRIIRKRIFRS